MHYTVEEVKVLLCYLGVTHVCHHEECSNLTIMDLYNKNMENNLQMKFRTETPGLGNQQAKQLWVNSGDTKTIGRVDGAYMPIAVLL